MTNKESMNEVLDAAVEYVANSGPFIAGDGYTSYAIGDDRRLREAVRRYNEDWN
jgi:hypothetical protein